jgi:uncharacterized damage-inducible protein DinB
VILQPRELVADRGEHHGEDLTPTRTTEALVPIAAQFLPEFDREMAVTRRMLERLPDDRLAWRPHARSYTLGALAQHLANLPAWAPRLLDGPAYDLAPGGGDTAPGRAVPGSRAELLAAFDANVASAHARIERASDAELMEPWSLLKAGVALFTLPRAAALRSFLMNHSIHHRGQLTVYLRLLDVPVPPSYGATADEAS